MDWDKSFAMTQKLLSKGLFHAASDLLRDLEHQTSHVEKLGQLYYALGRIFLYKDANYTDAVYYITKAVEITDKEDQRAKYIISLALAYLKMAEFDTSYRYITNLVSGLDGVSEKTRGFVLANLSVIQGANGFYHQSISSLEDSTKILADTNNQLDEVALNNNKGLAYLELGQFEEAEVHLKRALQLGGDKHIEPLSELGRLFLFQGRIVDSIRYAEDALTLIWPSIISYNKEEIARLCNLLAGIAMRVNEQELAVRLAEKAQVFFGQLGMWRQWKQMESEIEQWAESPPPRYISEENRSISLKAIYHFLQCLEALNAQELIHKRISKFLDIRTYYTQIFARELNLSDQDEEYLVLASRFADYGLTALEHEVTVNPNRSEPAFEQYKQHPSLSVRMVKALNLPERTMNIIADHHEQYDGGGYPIGKKDQEIEYLARVLSIIDVYATSIVLEEKNHKESLDGIRQKIGSLFDPDIAIAFEKMYDVP